MMNPKPLIPNIADPVQAPETRGVVLTKAATVYDLLSPPMLLWQEQVINRHTANLLNPDPDWRVLDVGCATGGMTLAVAAKLNKTAGGMAVGLDASPQMVGLARKKIKDKPCRFDIGVAEALPYPEGVFDAIVSTLFFHHLNLQDKLKALKEAHRVLQPGRTCIIVDMDVPISLLGKAFSYGGAWLFNQPEIVENIQGKLVPLFTEAGFSDLKRLAQNFGYITTFSMRKR